MERVNKDISFYYKHQDKKYHVNITKAAIEVAEICLQANIDMKKMVAKAMAAVECLSVLNNFITTQRRERIKPTFSEAVKNMCEREDYGDSDHLFGDDMSTIFKQAKESYTLGKALSPSSTNNTNRKRQYNDKNENQSSNRCSPSSYKRSKSDNHLYWDGRKEKLWCSEPKLKLSQQQQPSGKGAKFGIGLFQRTFGSYVPTSMECLI